MIFKLTISNSKLVSSYMYLLVSSNNYCMFWKCERLDPELGKVGTRSIWEICMSDILMHIHCGMFVHIHLHCRYSKSNTIIYTAENGSIISTEPIISKVVYGSGIQKCMLWILCIPYMGQYIPLPTSRHGYTHSIHEIIFHSVRLCFCLQ